MKRLLICLVFLSGFSPIAIAQQKPVEEPTIAELKAALAQLKLQNLQLQNALLQCQAPQVQQEVQDTQSALRAEAAKKGLQMERNGTQNR